jgi:pyruvyl transferase EpsO
MMAVSNRVLISKLQAMTHACLKDLVTDAPLALIDFPDIRNCGDSAIWLGEMAYLKERYAKRPAYVSRMSDFSAEDLKATVPEGPIFIHGGGNFGDIWPSHQDFRERVIERFPDRQIIQFPQSIHFQSEARAEQAARVIGRHKNFVLLVRDEESRDFAERLFDCEVRLCPDMAFCIGPIERAVNPTHAVLAMLREDSEKVGDHDVSAYPTMPVEDWITESRRSVRVSKLIGLASAYVTFHPREARLRLLDAAAHNRFRRGVRQISRGHAIVTDRLHVHIVSLLLGIPHAVLDNNYGKIRRFMAAFSDGTDLSYQATSLADGIEWARAQSEGAGR